MVQRLLGPRNEVIGVDKLDEMAGASHATGQALDPT